jgi:hypothetical protein
MRRPLTTFRSIAIAVVWLAAVGIVLLSYWIGEPLPSPLPQIVVGLGVVSIVLILLILPVVPFSFASSIEIALPPERVYDRLTDVLWQAARNPALRRLEVIYTRSGAELVQVGARSLIGRRIVLLAERVEAERPHRLVMRSQGAGTRSLARRVLTPTPTGTMLETRSDMRVSVFIWAAWAPRRGKIREAFAAELAKVKADLESAG